MVNSSVRKIYILRPNQDQLRKIDTDWATELTEAVAVNLGASSVYHIGVYLMYIFLTLKFSNTQIQRV